MLKKCFKIKLNSSETQTEIENEIKVSVEAFETEGKKFANIKIKVLNVRYLCLSLKRFRKKWNKHKYERAKSFFENSSGNKKVKFSFESRLKNQVKN